MARSLVTGLLCAFSLAAASSSLQVNESATKIILRDYRSAVSLAVRNSSTSTVPAEATLQWLNASVVAVSAVDQSLNIAPGESDAIIVFPLPANSAPDAVWYRLQYRLRAEGTEASGTLALAEVATHLFELHCSAPHQARPGETFQVQVSALHPALRKPIAGISVDGSLNIEGNPLEAKGTTDQNGVTTLDFPIPHKVTDDEADLKIEGTLGDFRQAMEVEVKFDNTVQIRIDTDKPLYQPGQMLHMRLLCVNAAGHAAAALPVSLRIEDPEGTGVYITHLATNRFGVAAADWQIPTNIRLGDYRVNAEPDEEPFAGQMQRVVKISRYDLPEFTLTAKPDRQYYLPGQNASIEIRAEYLFGKPVPRGHIRVVRENQREWNFRSQKWDIEEGDSQEGDADTSGHFVARINLAGAHSELAEKQRERGSRT